MGLLESESEPASVGEGTPMQTVAVEGPEGPPEELLKHADDVWDEIAGLMTIAEEEELDQMQVDDVRALVEGLEKARYIVSGVPADRRPAWFGSIDTRLSSLNKMLKEHEEGKPVGPAVGVKKPSVPVDEVEKPAAQDHR
jgi:hypothetical protein